MGANKRSNWAIWVLAILIMITIAGTASPSTIFPVVTTGTPIPGTGETFAAFGIPGISNGSIVFEGFNGNNDNGIYFYSGGSTRVVANTETQVPGLPEGIKFNQILFPQPFIRNGKVTFVGDVNSFASGVYHWQAGNLEVVANTNDIIPNSPGIEFESFFSNPTVANGEVFFTGGNGTFSQTPTDYGIYRASPGSAINVIVDNKTILQEGSRPDATIESFADSYGEGTLMAFYGRATGVGFDGVRVFDTNTGFVRTVADNTITIPDDPLNRTFFFTGFESRYVSISNGAVMFTHRGSTTSGIYAELGGTLTKIVNRDTNLPNSTVKFLSFEAAAFDNGDVLFQGFGTGVVGRGLYLSRNAGPPEAILLEGDMIGNRTVGNIFLGRNGFDNGEAVFNVHFTDGTFGVYRTTIGPPRPLPSHKIHAHTFGEVVPTAAGAGTGFMDQDSQTHSPPAGLFDVVNSQVQYTNPGGLPSGFDSQSSASPNGGLKAYSRVQIPLPVEMEPITESIVARADASYTRGFIAQAQGGPPPQEIGIDITVRIDGELGLLNRVVGPTSNPFGNDLIAEVVYRVIVHTDGGSVTVFEASGLLSRTAEPAFNLTATGPWANDFELIEEVNGARGVLDYEATFQDVYSIPLGDEARIEAILETETFGNQLAAGWQSTADFLNTATFEVSTDTPGATLDEVVPEPASVIWLASVVIALRRNRAA